MPLYKMNGGFNGFCPERLFDSRTPATTFLMTDIFMIAGHVGPINGSHGEYRFKGGNELFLDGHVSWKTKSALKFATQWVSRWYW